MNKFVCVYCIIFFALMYELFTADVPEFGLKWYDIKIIT